MPKKDIKSGLSEEADIKNQPVNEPVDEAGMNFSGQDEDKLRKERDEYLDGWKRAKAELINYKNDELKRMHEIIRFAGEDIVRDMIEILDSFDLCIGSLRDEDKRLAKGVYPVRKYFSSGVYMIRNQMEDALKKRGLGRIMVSVGREFDPALHEAISAVESDKPPGIVIEEIEKGYTWNGKLIRPARVVVSK